MYHVLFSLVSALCIFIPCMNLLPERLNRSVYTLIFLEIFLSAFFLSSYGQMPVIITVFCMLLIIYKFSKNKWLNLSCALFGYIFSITLNYLFIWLAQYILHRDLSQIYQSRKLTLLVSVSFCIICYLITKILSRYLNQQLIINSILTDFHINSAIFINFLIISIIYILNFSYGERMGYRYSIITFSGILFLLLFISTVFLMKQFYINAVQIEKTNYKLKQYDDLQTYTNELEKLYTSMRQFKHDYMNILSTLSAYIEQEDSSGLKNYFYHEILPISHDFADADTKLGSLANINILSLKSLLSSKLIFSIEKGIKTELELPDPVNDLPMDPIQFSRIIGIFLDNAIEAALESKEKIIYFCINRNEDHLIVIVKNTAIPPTSRLSDLTELGISSKDPQRGVGLYNVKIILDSYPNVTWDMEYIEPYFIQQLTLSCQ